MQTASGQDIHFFRRDSHDCVADISNVCRRVPEMMKFIDSGFASQRWIGSWIPGDALKVRLWTELEAVRKRLLQNGTHLEEALEGLCNRVLIRENS